MNFKKFLISEQDPMGGDPMGGMGGPMGGDAMGGMGGPMGGDAMGGMGGPMGGGPMGGDPMGGMGMGGDPMGMGGMGSEPIEQEPIIPDNADVWEVLDAILNKKQLKEKKPIEKKDKADS